MRDGDEAFHPGGILYLLCCVHSSVEGAKFLTA